VYFAPNNGGRVSIDAISTAAVHDKQRNRASHLRSGGAGPNSSTATWRPRHTRDFAAAGALGITVCVAVLGPRHADMDARPTGRQVHSTILRVKRFSFWAAAERRIIGVPGLWGVVDRPDAVDQNAPGGGGRASGGGVSTILSRCRPNQSWPKFPVSIDQQKNTAPRRARHRHERTDLPSRASHGAEGASGARARSRR